MPFSAKGNDDVEAMVDTLTTTIDSSSTAARTLVTESNLSNLTNTEIRQLAELSNELHHYQTTTDMDTDESEIIIEHDDDDHEVEVGAHEIEIETELIRSHSPPPEDVVATTTTTTTKSSKQLAPPPLRPLTIAPKPIAIKPIMSSTGQQQQPQLLLVQGTGAAGQAIKFVTTQGHRQELNLANLGRSLAIKTTGLGQQSGNISLVQSSSTATSKHPQQLVMKKILTPVVIGGGQQKTAVSAKPLQTRFTTSNTAKGGGHIVVVQQPQQQQQQKSIATLPSPTKTITLQQAQDMGLFTTNTKILTTKQQQKTIKIVPQQQLVVGGGGSAGKTIAVSQTMKSPTKILPATTGQQTIISGGKLTAAPQRFVLKNVSSLGQTVVPSQLIQLAGGGASGHATTTTTINPGQLHQINIPGKGVQYFKFVTAASSVGDTISTQTSSVVKSNSNNSQIASLQQQTTNLVLSEVKAANVLSSNITTKQLIKPTVAKNQTNNPITSTTQQVVVLPNYITSNQFAAKVPIALKSHSGSGGQTPTVMKSPPPPRTTTPTTPEQLLNSSATSSTHSIDLSLESNGMRPRKPCNCTKSQCLKLYCDCFANGEFCYMCNCMNCSNNLENEEHRQRAIKTCLERNPAAFRPKIGKAKDLSGDSNIRKHTKGCNCKRSGCLKNYCECYEAKIACSNNCKCVGCRNIEDSLDKKGLLRSLSIDHNGLAYQPYGSVKLSSTSSASQSHHHHHRNKDNNNVQFRPRRSSNNNNNKQPISFITDDVIEATAQCMLTISDSGESNMQDEELTKQQIIEEFGRCLTEIINYSTINNN